MSNPADEGEGERDGSGEYRDPVTPVESIAPSDLADRLAGGDPPPVLDVRNRDEVEAWSIPAPDATIVPYMRWLSADVTDSVADLATERGLNGTSGGPEGGPIVVVCGRGEASAYVASLLVAEGIDAVTLADGMRGWARVYERRRVDADLGGEGTLHRYRRPSSGCLAYLVVSGDEATVVDPLRAFADRYAADVEAVDADLRHVVDTHVHADHVSGVRELAAATDADPVLSRAAAERGVTDRDEFRLVDDGDALAVGTLELTAVHAPGHTSGMTAFRVGDVLLSGDALFVDGVPRPDLEADASVGTDGSTGTDGSDDGSEDEGAAFARDLHRTLTERFADLPDATVVAPGHHGADTAPAPDRSDTARLGDLRGRLPAFGMDADAFVSVVRDGMGPRPANHREIVAVNLGHRDADAETAFELELGPNNCAAAPAD